MKLRVMVPLLALAAAPAAAQTGSLCPKPDVPGSQQSPIDIRTAHPAALRPLGYGYPAVAGRMFNTGHNIRVDVDRGDSIVVDGKTFHLVEFHFHWPGEHELAGDTFPVEIHMVHAAADGTLAVLGTWVVRGRHNYAWDAIWARLPAGTDTVPVRVNVHTLFSLGNPNAERIYRYCGSLTTGTYDEGVTWLMRRTPIPMSTRQIERLRAVMGRYTRGVQPLNGREVRYRPANP